MTEADLLSFKKRLSEIYQQPGWDIKPDFDPLSTQAQDPAFIKALSQTVGKIQKKLLDNDGEFLKKFSPGEDLMTPDSYKNIGQNIQKNLGVMGKPAEETKKLIDELLIYNLVNNLAFSEEAFLIHANDLFTMFEDLPQKMQDEINAVLAEEKSPLVTQKLAAPEDVAPPKATATDPATTPATPPKSAPVKETPSKPWLSYPAPNDLFRKESYDVLSEYPPDEEAIHRLSEEALKRFVERAVEDGVAFEVEPPAKYPTKGIMAISRGNVTRYYDTSNITAAMFGLYKNAQGETVHFKPDLFDVGLAFEGLPVKGVPVTFWPGHTHGVDPEEIDPVRHSHAITTYPRNRAAAFFFTAIDDLPAQDRNRIVYKMGRRLLRHDETNPFFKAETYEMALENARDLGRESEFKEEMHRLAHYNDNAYAYYRLGSMGEDNTYDLTREYNKSLKEDYIPQRRKTLYEMDHGLHQKNQLNNNFIKAGLNTGHQEPTTLEEKFRLNVADTGLVHADPVLNGDTPQAPSFDKSVPKITNI